MRPFRPPTLSDEAIEALLAEAKEVPSDWRGRVRPKSRRGRHLNGAMEVVGAQGSAFEIRTRQHVDYPSNFSVILMYRSAEGHSYKLLRCNGLHPGGHRNYLEDVDFGTTFHIHRATLRYQEAGMDIDGFAEVDTSFSTLDQALSRVADLANISAGPEAVGLF